MASGEKSICIAVSGSIAAVKIVELIECLQRRCPRLHVDVVVSRAAEAFQALDYKGVRPAEGLAKLAAQGAVEVWRDADEWALGAVGDRVLHVELVRRNSLLLVAPLCANTLAAQVYGLCPSLLTCVMRAWPVVGVKGKPLLVAPAMNTVMWEHPVTAEQIAILKQRGVQVIPPVSKTLACGDVGIGAMAEPSTIADVVLASMDPAAAIGRSDRRGAHRGALAWAGALALAGCFLLVGLRRSGSQRALQ